MDIYDIYDLLTTTTTEKKRNEYKKAAKKLNKYCTSLNTYITSLEEIYSGFSSVYSEDSEIYGEAIDKFYDRSEEIDKNISTYLNKLKNFYSKLTYNAQLAEDLYSAYCTACDEEDEKAREEMEANKNK